MKRVDVVPARVAIATERRLQRATLDLLTGTRKGRRNDNQAVRAVSTYLAMCREATARRAA